MPIQKLSDKKEGDQMKHESIDEIKVNIELTLRQLDNLLSNRINLMVPVIDYIRENLVRYK